MLNKPTEFKTLIIDIETRPSLAYVWSLWDQNVGLNQIVESGEIISWAAKWHKSNKVEFSSIHHDKKNAMIQKIWDLLDEAEVVVHFNGKKFDVPHLNAEFLRADLKPPSNYHQIDLLDTVKRRFKFISNKLEYVAGRLKIGAKVSNEGFPLWAKCMAGDAAAWQKMKTYNIGDVVLTETLYNKLLPWIQRHPSRAAASGLDICPNCGCDRLRSKGYVFLRTGKYLRFVCTNCGKSARSTQRTSKTGIVEVAE